MPGTTDQKRRVEVWDDGCWRYVADAEPLAHREVQEDPSPLLRRLARALLASCLTTDRCALAPVRRGIRCFLLQIHWQTLTRHSGIQQQFEGECLGHGTHPARRCAYLRSLALFPGIQDNSTQWLHHEGIDTALGCDYAHYRCVRGCAYTRCK